MPKVQHIIVSADEGGQKLLNFLRRRLGPDVPQSLLMRIIRKGEVRVDKGRAKPFDRLSAGQDVRIPPIRVQERMQTPAGGPLDIIFREKGLLAVAKPAGLPVQPGTGHSDAVSERLRAQFAEADFTPTPAHRLDRDTSGILLCGASFEALRNLQQGFAEHSIGKFYLAWVQGNVEPGTVLEMQDEMDKTGAPGHERMTIGSGKTAQALARCLTSDDDRSLLEIDLRTGRTHQIRLQLASRGLPIIGDSKYGFKTRTQKMYLHAWKIVLGSGEIITNLPAWNSPYQLVNDWFK